MKAKTLCKVIPSKWTKLNIAKACDKIVLLHKYCLFHIATFVLQSMLQEGSPTVAFELRQLDMNLRSKLSPLTDHNRTDIAASLVSTLQSFAAWNSSGVGLFLYAATAFTPEPHSVLTSIQNVSLCWGIKHPIFVFRLPLSYLCEYTDTWQDSENDCTNMDFSESSNTLLNPKEPQSVLQVAVEPWENQSQLTSVKLLVLGIYAHNSSFMKNIHLMNHTHIRSNERQCFIH